MYPNEVAHYKSETYDLWLGRRRDGSLVLEGFLKVGNTLKHLVCTPEDATRRGALNLLTRYGREAERPYLLGGPCDGSIGAPVLALYLDFCARHGLDARTLYAEAYPDEVWLEEDDITAPAHWQGVHIPHTWTAACFSGLLESLTAINYHTLRSVLEEAALEVAFPTGVMERDGYVCFRGDTRCYGPRARFTWGYVVTPTGKQVWEYDPWQSTNGVVPNHYWLSIIAAAASRDGNTLLERRLIEEALRLARSGANKRHYQGWLEQLRAA